MRSALLKLGLTAGAITSVIAVTAPAASAVTYWTTIRTYWGGSSYDLCQAQGAADEANPSSPAVDYRCLPTERTLRNDVVQPGYILQEEYSGGV